MNPAILTARFADRERSDADKRRWQERISFAQAAEDIVGKPACEFFGVPCDVASGPVEGDSSCPASL